MLDRAVESGMEVRLRLSPARALREKRLAALLAGRDPRVLGLHQAVEVEQVLGSLELAGIAAQPEDLQATEGPAAALVRARRAVLPEAPLTVDALIAWHRPLETLHALETPDAGRGLRTTDRTRESGPAPAPA